MRILILAIFITSFYTSVFSQNSTNYFINKEGENVLLYKNIKKKRYTKYDYSFDTDYALTGQFLWYHNKEGKLKKEGQSNVKELHYNGAYYINKPTKGNGQNRLHEVLIVTEKYTLTQYFWSSYYWVYIFDNNSGKNILQKKKLLPNQYDGDKEFLKSTLLPKLKDCPGAVEIMRTNLNITKDEYDNQNMFVKKLFKGLSNYQCE